MNILQHTGVIILAAGSSSRLGEPKQLVQFRGKPLLQRMIDLCMPLDFNTRVLVLGANADKIRQAVEPGSFSVIENDDWSEGIASSIRQGVARSLELNPQTEHLLFLLSDQPFVTTELVQKLLETHRTGSREITASFYRQEVGVPAIFAKSQFRLLQELGGDQGAKKIMKRHEDNVTPVPFEKGHFDLDTPGDYAKLRELET